MSLFIVVWLVYVKTMNDNIFVSFGSRVKDIAFYSLWNNYLFNEWLYQYFTNSSQQLMYW